MVRCYSIANLQLSDLTYNVILDNITTCLEPTLGIINACLPILQPVASKASSSISFTWIKSLKTSSTPLKALRSSNLKRDSSRGHTHRNDAGEFHELSESCENLNDVSHSHVFVTTDITVSRDEQRHQVRSGFTDRTVSDR